ncbi:MAG TPA: hypothetical protein VHT91_49995 [Kofleriaceae bacterium]|jgi:hypothetical protein|nr:hypothetical protein [Kofleriaceae bacterium]
MANAYFIARTSISSSVFRALQVFDAAARSPSHVRAGANHLELAHARCRSWIVASPGADPPPARACRIDPRGARRR